MAESDRNATVVALGGWQLVGTTIAGRYKVEGLLKEAETGSVFLVQHLQMRRRFALRLIPTNNPKNAEAVARFERDAAGQPPLEHPNIAAASDFGRTESGEFFAALEYLEGAPRLRDVFDGKRLPPARVLHIARQLAGVIEHLHEAGTLYQELRPENIWLTARKGDSDFVKVLDPSVAKIASGPVPLTPEQATGEKADARSDLYALGLLLYEMLTGKPPLEPAGATKQLKQLISGAIPPMKAAAPDLAVPAALESVVTRLLSRAPAERFQTAAELRAALDGISASSPQAAQPTAQPVAAASSAPAPEAPAPASAPPPSQPAAAAVSAPAAPEPAAPREELDRSRSGKLDALRARLPQAGEAIAPYRANLPPILRKVPLWLLGLIVVLGLALPLVVRSIVLSATSKETSAASSASAPAPAAAPAVTSQASDAQLQAARAQGAQAVASLLEKFPHDGRVHRALVTALAAQSSGVAAMQALAKLVALDPGAAEDPAMQQAVAAAVGAQGSREAAVQVVESQMGTLGADILYDLANKAGQNRAKALLYKQLVARPAVRQHASQDTALAIELQLADGCDAKNELLERAGQEGGQRVLGYLRYLTKPQPGCGPLGMLDCWMCMRQDNDLADAISAIEARTQGHP
ncbi:MAG: serine/threonine-protein kinase [Polyangia bacterium]